MLAFQLCRGQWKTLQGRKGEFIKDCEVPRPFQFSVNICFFTYWSLVYMVRTENTQRVTVCALSLPAGPWSLFTYPQFDVKY